MNGAFHRVAFPVVQNYALSVWKKYEIEKIMMNAKGFFFFKFATEEGMLSVIQNGPWMIRTNPSILNKWSPEVSLTKEDLTKVPVWIKLYDVPQAGFTEDGLSIIASKIGSPMMLDSYTSTMCVESWGRPNFARAMIEVSAGMELVENIKVATPSLNGKRTIVDTVRVEYEWKLPRCSGCKVFGHNDSQCPNLVVVKPTVVSHVDDDGFKLVTNKHQGGSKNYQQLNNGVVTGKVKKKLVYRPKPKEGDGSLKHTDTHVSPSDSSLKTRPVHHKGVGSVPVGPSKVTLNEGVSTANQFSALNPEDGDVNAYKFVDEESDVEINDNETSTFITSKDTTEGASTPVLDESHVNVARLTGICNFVFPSWSWSSNNSVCRSGTRIIVGWDPSMVHLMILSMTDQIMHCLVSSVSNDWKFYALFVYANNYYIKRRQLWANLNTHKSWVGALPWVMMGDFNVSLDVGESIAGSSCSTLAMREFRECVDNINMSDLNQSGFQYTWNQRPNSLSSILKKIDRVMANDGFISLYTNSYVIFQPYRISDHSPAVLKIPVATMKKPKSFKFSNYIAKHADFHDTVATVWNQNIQGHVMYCVVKKLHLLKSPMRKLVWSKGDIHKKVIELHLHLEEAQQALDANPHSPLLRAKESEVLKSYNESLLEEESLLKQKAKIEWL
ncbi:uncharacterized protein [Rutidosis leptorrhynchoides]|uniref:uncharacterized protein n=1 Tax=Rutidosis leptorrhynchoides TaxID=125765 RepID=UPI003A99F858